MSNTTDALSETTQVFAAAAELFSLMGTPMRLRIISATCHQERSVGELLLEVGGTQSNLSQHLAVLWRSGVLARRKEGTTVFYRVVNQQAAALCRTVCTQIAMELGDDAPHLGRLAPLHSV